MHVVNYNMKDVLFKFTKIVISVNMYPPYKINEKWEQKLKTNISLKEVG